MNQLFVFHGTHKRGGRGSPCQGGNNEFVFGPFKTKRAKAEEKAHIIADRALRLQGNGPRVCRTQIEVFKWETRIWGTIPQTEEEDYAE